MSKITQLNEKAIGVEVPDDAHSFEIYENNVIGGWCVMFLRGQPDYACSYSPNLPPGSWSMLGRPEEITEDQWKGIFPNMGLFEISALLKSKGLNPETTLILIKQ